MYNELRWYKYGNRKFALKIERIGYGGKKPLNSDSLISLPKIFNPVIIF